MRSLLVRISSLFRFIKLVQNFRSHENILQFPNARFYKNELQPCGDLKIIDSFIRSPILASRRFPIVFHSVSGRDTREASSPSFFNIDEASQVKEYVRLLRSDRKYPTSKPLTPPSPVLTTHKCLSRRRYWYHYSISCAMLENPCHPQGSCRWRQGCQRRRVPRPSKFFLTFICHHLH